MIHIGFFSEMHTFCDNGSIRDHMDRCRISLTDEFKRF